MRALKTMGDVKIPDGKKKNAIFFFENVMFQNFDNPESSCQKVKVISVLKTRYFRA